MDFNKIKQFLRNRNNNNIEIIDGMNKSRLKHPFEPNFSPNKGEFKFLINSFGGNSTSTLIKFINPYYSKITNHMWYHLELKHCLSPPKIYTHFFKAIYIYGDPRESLISIYRRNLQDVHYFNTFQVKKKMPKTIEDYLDNEIDHFQFNKHHNNWTNKISNDRKFKILVIDYQKLWECKNQILNFLELPKSNLKDFPKYKTRQSSLNYLSSTYRRKINQMYLDLTNKINERPSIEII